MTQGPPPPPPIPNSTPAKKGMSPWAWVAIGCGGLVVLGFVVFLALGYFVFNKAKEVVEETTGGESVGGFLEKMQENPARTLAETAIRANPELELNSTDEEAGTITFTNTRTGEQATLNFEDIAEGRFSMSTDEGEYSIDASNSEEGGITFSGPDGQETRLGAGTDLTDVPDWVPSYPDLADAQSTMHAVSNEGVMGMFTGKSTDDAQEVVDHFKQWFEDQGYEVEGESLTRTGDGSFGGVNGNLGDGRMVNVVVMQSSEGTQVTINYNEKKQ